MPDWSREELNKAARINATIDECRAPRRQRRCVPVLVLSLREALPLFEGLGGGTRAVLVRQLLRALGFDEHNHVEWRLEHKLVQALALQSYLPGLFPVTRGLRGTLAGKSRNEFQPFLASEFPAGYIIKTALGDSSGEAESKPPAVEDILRDLPDRGSPAPPQLAGEKYIVQEKIPIAQEYRVHSLEDLVVDDLTFRRYTAGSIPGEREALNAEVQSMLDRLPGAIVGGSLLAWDVARKPDGGYAIVEVNFSGFHPVFKRGFHCSGYYHDYNWGSCDTARLLNHVARVDGVEVVVHADAPERPEENRFYADVAAWQARHAAARAQAQAEPEMREHGHVA
jgi:hypothetical protein